MRLHFLMVVGILVLLCEAVSAAGPDYTIELDCSRVNGTIKSFAHINCGPLPNPDVDNATDLTRQYREVGISMVRNHDFSGPTDVSWIFPDWEADPSLESSYDFSVSDTYITAIVESGAEVFFRLGERASTDEALRQPPPDFDTWAEVCKHIVMHYNEGWADGYQYGITYWEVWNEPDLEGFWTGTAEQYYEMYRKTAQTLKAHDPSLKVGGPCTSSITDERFTKGFLDYVTQNNVPLDFYSWHRYADTPNQLYLEARAVRDMLDSYGMTECENINTEWNINLFLPQRDNDNAKNAAFTACSLTAFQDAGIDAALRYRGTQGDSALARMIGLDLSLFTVDGTYKRPALSYLAMQHLAQDSPVRIATPAMDAAQGITWLAGKSADNSTVTVLISNYDAADATCSLSVGSLPWQGEYTAAHYLIDEHHHFKKVEQTTESGSLYSATVAVHRNSVLLVRLTTTEVLPAEGPEVAEIPPVLQMPIFDGLFRLLSYWLLVSIFG